MRSLEISVAIVATAITFGVVGSASAQSSGSMNSNTMHHGSMNSQPAVTGGARSATSSGVGMRAMDREVTGSTARGASQFAPGRSSRPANEVAPGRSDGLPPGQRMQRTREPGSR